MILFKKASDLKNYLQDTRASGLKINFIPTMGALHQGHLSLIHMGSLQKGLTLCSIFVNPTQFNDPSDFEKYPITLESDLMLLEQAGCNLVFLPSVGEVYPDAVGTEHYELGYLEQILEGKHRPGHFQGVCQVVRHLLDITRPDVLLLGQKDYQQCMVIKKLMELTGHTAKVLIGSTVREPSGLAMSSRNRRLSAAGQEKAAVLYQTLQYLKDQLSPGPLQIKLDEAHHMLLTGGFTSVDYIAIADANTLEPLQEWDGKRTVIAVAAAFLEEVRLIDNLYLSS